MGASLGATGKFNEIATVVESVLVDVICDTDIFPEPRRKDAIKKQS